ncbi:MAG: hypothetical protein AAGF12_43465, partial [Myxococcota bacterium]
MAGVVAWFGWLPSLARDKAVEAAARRGLDLEIGDVSVRLSGVVLSDVTVRTGGIEASVEEIGVRVSAWALLSGESKIEAVQARGMSMEVDLADPELRPSMAQLRGSAANPESPSDARGEERVISALDVELTVRDELGPVVEVEGGQGTLNGPQLDLSANRLRLQGGEDQTVE